MPVVFILSPGSEPSSDIQKLGDRVGMELDHIKFISLGQGQEQVLVVLALVYYDAFLINLHYRNLHFPDLRLQ